MEALNSSLILRFDLRINDEGYLAEVEECEINQKGNLVGVILRNDSENKVFFYQLWIKRWPKEPSGPPYWVRKGEEVDGKTRYLLDDYISSFNSPPPRIGEGFVSYELELYDTITSFMEEGGIKKKDFGKWKITGIYFGSALWGRVYNKTAWRKMGLRAE